MHPAAVPPCPREQIDEVIRNWSLASPTLAAGMEDASTAAEALARLGLRLCRENRAAEAAEVLRAAVSLDPSNNAYWENLGGCLDLVGNFADACCCLERSIELDGKRPETWLLLGTVQSKQGDCDGAATAYRAAIELDAASPLAWQCLALVNEKQGDWAAAIENFARCAALGGASAGVLANLGKLCYQVGRFQDAMEVYKAALELEAGNANYLEMLRRLQFLHDVIAGRSVGEALASVDSKTTGDTSLVEDELNEFIPTAIALLSGFGHAAAAKRLAEYGAKRAPDSVSAAYVLQALSGQALDRSPPEYIVEYFDGLAAKFDDKLVKGLHYEVPAKLVGAIQRVVPMGQRFEAADLGCGTGLCGPLLRPIATTLVGVDLAPRMVEEARRRGCYDELIREDILAFLKRSPGKFDLLISADVFIYFGDLRPVFADAAAALRPDGLLAFSTESASDGTFRLLPSGRFAHNHDYLHEVGSEWFDECISCKTVLRHEALEPVRGILYVWRRRQ